MPGDLCVAFGFDGYSGVSLRAYAAADCYSKDTWVKLVDRYRAFKSGGREFSLLPAVIFPNNGWRSALMPCMSAYSKHLDERYEHMGGYAGNLQWRKENPQHLTDHIKYSRAREMCIYTAAAVIDVATVALRLITYLPVQIYRYFECKLLQWQIGYNLYNLGFYLCNSFKCNLNPSCTTRDDKGRMRFTLATLLKVNYLFTDTICGYNSRQLDDKFEKDRAYLLGQVDYGSYCPIDKGEGLLTNLP